jgi:hypothetical protein
MRYTINQIITWLAIRMCPVRIVQRIFGPTALRNILRESGQRSRTAPMGQKWIGSDL